MTGLQVLFALREGGTISAKETEKVDLALSNAKSSDIPNDQVQNVKNYINAELLHNKGSISNSEIAALEKLLKDLESRK